MTDFVLFIHPVKPESEIRRTADYFSDLFPEQNPTTIELAGLDAVISCGDPADKYPQPVHCSRTRATFFILGEFRLPERITKNSASEYQSPVSTLQMLLDEHGTALFRECPGNFVVAAWYEQEGRFELINSKLGLFPVYYRQSGKGLVVSTRLGVFRKIFGDLRTDDGVIIQHCLYHYPFTGKTFFRDIMQLPSATLLIHMEGSLRREKYWSAGKDISRQKHGLSASVQLLDETFGKLMQHHCRNHEKTAISLTGGWDGRLLLAYALEYLPADRIILYSFGTKKALDVTIPKKIAAELGYQYHPVYLDDPAYLESQIEWANRTVGYSDGLRSIKRVHYLYTMNHLKKELGIGNIISGIGGSNLMKSSNYMPCNVFNAHVIALVESEEPEQTLRDHYKLIRSRYPGLFEQVDEDAYLESFQTDGFRELYQIRDKRERFRHYLTSEIEMKYFGSELQSYRHLISNYSPFFDDVFIHSIMQTVFFRSSGMKGLMRSFYNALLYGRLVTKHNRKLAEQVTDRNFSLYDVITPANYPKLAVKYISARSGKEKVQDNFRTDDLSRRFLSSVMPFLKLPAALNVESSFLTNYISAVRFTGGLSG